MARRKIDFSNVGQLDEAMAGVARPSLFGDDGNDYRLLKLDRIEPNPDQPRRDFAAAALEELAASIQEHGLLQPILVRALPGERYQLVAGERRLRAVRLAGRTEIAAIVTRTSDPATLALVENLQRQDLDAVELARGLALLRERHGARQGTLARLIGKSDAYVSRMLGLLSLPAAVLEDYPHHRDTVSAETLVEISMAEPAAQPALWAAAKAGLSSKAVRLARSSQGGEPGPSGATPAGATPAAPRPAPPLRRVVRSASALVRALRALRAQAVPLDDPHRTALRALRDAIDAMLQP
jgi:ParB family chromosome partitioning protein